MEELKQNPTLGGVLAIAIVVLGLVFAGVSAYRTARKAREAAEALAAREMAVMEEEIRTTGFGGLCIALMIVTMFGAAFGYSAAKTVFQQIEAGVSLMAGLMLFGLGAALGRRRTYRIYRSESRGPL